MKESLTPIEDYCPIAATLKKIDGKYKVLILWKLLEDTQRFSALNRFIPCATPKMLTQQLRELERDGLIDRKVYPVVPPKVEYSLTDFGKTLYPLLQLMYQWGETLLDTRQKQHK